MFPQFVTARTAHPSQIPAAPPCELLLNAETRFLYRFSTLQSAPSLWMSCQSLQRPTFLLRTPRVQVLYQHERYEQSDIKDILEDPRRLPRVLEHGRQPDPPISRLGLSSPHFRARPSHSRADTELQKIITHSSNNRKWDMFKCSLVQYSEYFGYFMSLAVL